jgi:hypothetical protein
MFKIQKFLLITAMSATAYLFVHMAIKCELPLEIAIPYGLIFGSGALMFAAPLFFDD